MADLKVFLNHSDLSPIMHAVAQEETTHLLLYDQLTRRFVYGKQEPDQEMQWEGILGTEAPREWTPQVTFLEGPTLRTAIIESAPGQLSQVVRESEQWTVTPLASGDATLQSMDATWSNTEGLAMCAADSSGKLFYGWRRPQATFRWEEIVVPESNRAPHGLCRVLWAGGRPLIFAAGRPDGVLTLLRDDEVGWKATALVEDANPMALETSLLQGVPVAFYLDRNSDALLSALGESGAATITTLDSGIDLDQDYRGGLSVVQDPEHDVMLVGFFDRRLSMLTVIAYQLEQDWVVVQKQSDVEFAPTMVAYPSGAVSAFAILENSKGFGELSEFPLL